MDEIFEQSGYLHPHNNLFKEQVLQLQVLT